MTSILDPQGNIIGIKEKDAWQDKVVYYIYEYVFSTEYLLQTPLTDFVQIFPKTFPTDMKIYIFDSIIHQRIQEEIYTHEVIESMFYHVTNYDELDSIATDELYVDLEDLLAELASTDSNDTYNNFHDLLADLASD